MSSIIGSAGLVDGQTIYSEHLLRIIHAFTAVTQSAILLNGELYSSGSSTFFGTASFYGNSVQISSSFYLLSGSNLTKDNSSTKLISWNSASGLITFTDTNAISSSGGSNSGSFSGSFQGDGSQLSGVVASANPAGQNKSIQFNDTGSTSGSGLFIFDKTTKTVILTGSLIISGSSINFNGASSITGSIISGSQISGSFFGTASNAVSASYSDTSRSSSYSDTARSASYSLTSSVAITASYALTGTGGSSTPGGSNTQIQYNSSSVFQGTSRLIFDYTNNIVILSGSLYTNDNVSLFSTTGSFGGGSQVLFINNTTISGSLPATGGLIIRSQDGNKLVARDVSGSEYVLNILVGSTAPANPLTGSLWIDTSTSGSSAVTPGGPSQSIQFNDSGSFSGSGNFTYSKATNILNITGSINVSKFLSPTGSLSSSLGASTLSGGVITVSSSIITAKSKIFLTINGVGTLANASTPYEDTPSRAAGSSFTIKSLNVLDNSTIDWFIIEPSN